MSRLLSFFLLFAVFLAVPLDSFGLHRAVAPRQHLAFLQTQAPTGRIVIKFAEDSGVTVAESGLAAKAAGTLNRLSALLAQVAPGARLERRFSRPAADLDAERLAAEVRSGHRLPNLNRYGQLTPSVPRGDRAALIQIVRKLAADPAVETAFLEPVAVPAALGFDALTGATPALPGPIADRDQASRDQTIRTTVQRLEKASPADTPDFSSLQGYLGTAPDGIEAWSVAGNPGARGSGLQVVDVEGAWLWNHEDLTTPFYTSGGVVDQLSWRNHGTAVLGEIRGSDNGLGVRGIVPDCAVGGASIAEQSLPEALNNAAAALSPGDIILIELHAPGPNAIGIGQFGYVAMEFWQDNFDAILLATASGRIVCEAAGNGEQDFDDPIYQGLFDRSLRDSGAIMCGATAGSSLDPAYFSNYGSRVDLSGWGWSVTTCGYGDLQGGSSFPEEEWYTDGFSGTSSASPIVVGSVASLVGMVQAGFGVTLDASLARHILVESGTPTNGPQQVGPRPNLLAAWDATSAGIGEITGVVTDMGTGLPVADVLVSLVDASDDPFPYSAFKLTADDGSYHFPLLAGDYELTFTSFFYESAVEVASVTDGGTTFVDVAMTARPTVGIAGHVISQSGAPLADVRVTPLGVPLAGTTTLADGSFTITGAPQDYLYQIFYDALPGYGADILEVSTFGPSGPFVTANQELPTTDIDFELDDGGFVADNAVWSWGTPLAGGPEGSGFSGLKCWGVGMTDNYEDDVTGTLTSPIFSYGFTPAPEALFLSFHFWSDTEGGFDGVHLEIFNHNVSTEWEHRVPLEGYSDITLGGIGYQGGWSADSGGWQGTVFDISDLIGPDFQIRLVFGSDSNINGPGFWVDDFTFDTGNVVVSVDPGEEIPPSPRVALAAFPNPFNPRTTIAWKIPAPGPLVIEVYDLQGRKVRSLWNGSVATSAGTVTWQGDSDTGRTVASGVYVVRLQDGSGGVVTKRISLVQ